MSKLSVPAIEIELLGVLSRKKVSLRFFDPGKKGIFFELSDGDQIRATTDHLISASRNSVLGNGKSSICFVEHLLASISLLGINQIAVEVFGEEIPLEDGSGLIWYELLKDWKGRSSKILSEIDLPQPLSLSNDRNQALYALPSDHFQITYLFQSPIDGSQTWTSWRLGDDPLGLISARTFAPSLENELIGVKGKVLSYDSEGFDLPLRFTDEPARHKILDLVGDLTLAGINPLNLKAHFISYKAGHNLNTSMAKMIREILKS
ncbi:MAG: UDP-3-O-acyl-N-acetylglucosamine deacetylase [Candidatus Caenarcaniphilales bacterium]|nr:UDP-3-O-acyl-N-acetylglucosamine deacetylase [Candidatus Caenarcaniphilales bacterium]